ncbi:MAG: hypothetical protein ACLR4Z_05760 [Butyricicoccaceae bacterium]
MALPLMLLPSALIGSIGTALLPIVTATHARRNRAPTCARPRRPGGHDGRTDRHPGDRCAHSARTLAQPAAVRAAAHTAVCGARWPAAVVTYYQMITSGLLNALRLQSRSVLTAVLAECVQLVLVIRWCSRPALGIYGYLLAMLLSGAGARPF